MGETNLFNTLVTPAGQNCVNTTKTPAKKLLPNQHNANVFKYNIWNAINKSLNTIKYAESFIVCFMENLAKQSNKILTTHSSFLL